MTNRESDWMSECHDWIIIKVAGKQTVSTADWMKGYLLERIIDNSGVLIVNANFFPENSTFHLKLYFVHSNLNIMSLWNGFLGLKQQITKCFDTRCSPKRPEYASNVVFSQLFSGSYKHYKITNESARRTACFQLLYAQLV